MPNHRDKTDYFYKIHVGYSRGGGYFVYYRTPMEHSLHNVAKYAVRDGDLHQSFLHMVDSVVRVTPEEYFEHMWE